MSDPQAVQEEIDAYVSSLLNLVGIEADPLSSREHILLSTIINDAWTHGRALDLATVVASVQQPPVRKVGVLELDSYYPADERMKLAMKLNGLLASPAFASWLVGQRIDIASMLRAPDGRPRCAVVSIAHLDDAQRQSAVSVVLAKLISWMRRQSRHLRPAHPALHGRGRRLPAPERQPTHQGRRSCCFSSRRARSAWAWSSRPRTRSTWTTRPCRTPAPG